MNVETFKTVVIDTEQLRQLLSDLIMIDAILSQAFFITFCVGFSALVSQSSTGPSLLCFI